MSLLIYLHIFTIEDKKMAQTSKYKRVVLKLSGEALAGDKGFGINPIIIKSVAQQVAEVAKMDCEIAVIVGGGNIWRGKTGSDLGMDRGTADYMGMLVTVMNALALQDSLEQLDCDTRVLTSIEMKQVAEPYIRRRAIRHLEKNVLLYLPLELVILTSQLTQLLLYAAEVEADVILMGKNNVDGVYSADPKVDANAIKYEHLTHIQMLQEGLQVMDSTASSFCMDNNIPLNVFYYGRR